ncbi:hypothetical protein EDB89DRAFT_224681 [Lactarius sanguifluus]|nr:hypothetical protein EDB89DRAFT_224681 [Lactarius sanguifluus]
MRMHSRPLPVISHSLRTGQSIFPWGGELGHAPSHESTVTLSPCISHLSLFTLSHQLSTDFCFDFKCLFFDFKAHIPSPFRPSATRVRCNIQPHLADPRPCTLIQYFAHPRADTSSVQKRVVASVPYNSVLNPRRAETMGAAIQLRQQYDPHTRQPLRAVRIASEP